MTAAALVPGSTEWLKFVSSSKVAAILGLSPWESPRSLWLKMHGDLPPEEQTKAQSRGTHLEAGVLSWFFADNEHLARLGGESTVLRGDLPWASCSPDDIATDTTTGESFPVETKTDGRGVFGEPGAADAVPLYYLVQGVWTMHIGKWDRIVYPVLGPFLDRVDHWVEYAEYADLAQEIEARCKRFYDSLQADEPPPLDGTTATYDAVRAVSTVGDGDWEAPADLAWELCAARAAVPEAEARHNLARATALEAMGGAKRITFAGQVLGQKQNTRGGLALYPPRKPVDLNALTPSDTKAA